MPPSPRPDHLLSAILSSTEDALLGVAPDGTIETWSQGAAHLYGYTEGEITGKPFTLLLPLYEQPALTELLRFARSGDFAPMESVERLRKDGSLIRLVVQHTAVRNEHGELTAILERGRAVARYPGSPAERPLFDDGLLWALLEQMPAIFWTTDRSLRITSNWGSGSGAAKLKPGELVGRSIYGYLKCEELHAAPVAQHVEALRGVIAHFEYHHRNRDFEIRVGPLRAADGEIIGCIGVGST